MAKENLVLCYKIFSFKRIEGLVSTLEAKPLELIVKEIPESKTYLEMKKKNK